MGCYFMVNIYLEDKNSRKMYDEYIKKVKPIVESYGGEYLIRTEDILAFDENWKPDRVIVIRFENKKAMDKCFSSEEYQEIKNLRINSVDSRVIIVNGK